MFLPEMSTPTIVVIVLATIHGFLTGLNDNANVVATIISSRALSARRALFLSAVTQLVAPFLFGVAIASTIGQQVVDVSEVTTTVLQSALLSAIVWTLAAGLLGIPSSSSHAVLGGLMGAAVVEAGWEVLLVRGLAKVLGTLLLAPMLGIVAGFLLMQLVLYLVRGASPRVAWLFHEGQVLTTAWLSLAHGTNNAQRTMGLIALALVVGGAIPSFQVPFWVVALSAASMAAGASIGGWRTIRTLGGKFYRIRPLHALVTQLASATVLTIATLLGGPVSTTQVVSSAIVGVGSKERASQVRWRLAAQVARAWLLTMPATALLGALLHVLFTLS